MPCLQRLVKLVFFIGFVSCSCANELLERIECFPERESNFSGYSKEACLNRSCEYDETAPTDMVQCYLNSNYGYIMQGDKQETAGGFQLRLTRNQAVDSMFPDPIDNVILDVQYYTNDILRFRLYDANNPRYEVSIPLKPSNGRAPSPKYNFTYHSNSSRDNLFFFKITRQADQATLFDTSAGGLVLNNQFLQIVSRLQSRHVFGFGENNHDTLKHDVNDRRPWGIFARDQGTNEQTRLNHYGTHPFYLVMEQLPNTDQVPSGNMHGVLLLNSNAMDYSFTPMPSVTIRTIGGILDFFVFLGPKPEQVIQQYTWLVGYSILPPYWSIGFHLSRWEYRSLAEMQKVIKRNRDAGVPLDVQHADIDYMDARKTFTIDSINYAGMKEYFLQLNNEGVRTIIILDPALFDDQVNYQPTVQGIQEDVFIKWSNGSELMKGACWPGEVFFPDYFTARTQQWWSRLIRDFRRDMVSFDGLWIDMNEPAVFDTNEERPWNAGETGSNYTLKCPENSFDDPPYRTMAAFRYDEINNKSIRLSQKTLCLSAQQGEIDSSTGKHKYIHYDVHNLYGWSQTKPTLDALRAASGKRGLVLPRSTFVGSGQWSGHWLGDNTAEWHEMKRSIIGMTEFNWFGIPFNGADICGYFNNATEEMCTRWMQVGAFYPFSRNHNNRGTIDQDPAAWSTTSLNSMISVLRIRYTILPYYYTLFYKAHTQGSTVIRPLFHEFPSDKATLDIYLQFLVGPYVMIAPVTDEGARAVQVYIPSSPWYNFYNGSIIPVQNQFMSINAPLETIPILLRGGAIVPTQGFANNTKLSRMQPFGLIIVPDLNGNAEGDLFYDDGESIDTITAKSYFLATFKWSSSKSQLTMMVDVNGYKEMSNMKLNSLTIYGLKPTQTTVHVAGKQFSTSLRPNTQIVEVNDMGLPMDPSRWINNVGSINFIKINELCKLYNQNDKDKNGTSTNFLKNLKPIHSDEHKKRYTEEDECLPEEGIFEGNDEPTADLSTTNPSIGFIRLDELENNRQMKKTNKRFKMKNQI
ncbi:unnamed protein product [Rotaria socialis]|uniref:P-type domain-containing protein n=1 Tax=Rotaria socialis TaxID=392032 RepID=A0A820W987_9BILA|nr:unnamed protein product [Rotaria socialis]